MSQELKEGDIVFIPDNFSVCRVGKVTPSTLGYETIISCVDTGTTHPEKQGNLYPRYTHQCRHLTDKERELFDEMSLTRNSMSMSIMKIQENRKRLNEQLSLFIELTSVYLKQ